MWRYRESFDFSDSAFLWFVGKILRYDMRYSNMSGHIPICLDGFRKKIDKEKKQVTKY
jgi:hypothetical protein